MSVLDNQFLVMFFYSRCFYADEVGSFEIMEQKISVGANFFEITKSCAGTTVVVKVEGNIGACQAEVKSKNFKKGQTGMFFTKP